MSLATRCTSCGTVFRVVQDQLKISEGWVRCGRCDAVFNALEGLFDLVRDAPSVAAATEGEAAAAVAAQAALPLASAKVASAPGSTSSVPAGTVARPETPNTAPPSIGLPSFDSTAFDTTLPDIGRPGRDTEASAVDVDVGPVSTPAELEASERIDAHLFRNRRVDGAAGVKVGARDRLEFSDARFDSDLFVEAASAEDTELIETTMSGVTELPLESTSHHQPDFLRRADRRARWGSTPMRVALSVVATLAVVALLLQVGLHHRDTVAARWPATRPLLASACKAFDCTIEAPRRIDELAVESTALTRAIGLDAFTLSLTLRSRSELALALPSVDLSLTDGNGRLVARRALSPQDFGTARVVQPGGEAALQVMLNTGSARVAGYTVEIFYP